jgi:hypothetical protein
MTRKEAEEWMRWSGDIEVLSDEFQFPKAEEEKITAKV